MSERPAGQTLAASDLGDAAWVISVASPGGTVRFDLPSDAPDDLGGGWIEVRPLSHREALERESLGVYEEYELSDSGRVLSVVRRYDFWAMAAYDYSVALVDYCLPERLPSGELGLSRKRETALEESLSLLASMPPALADWVQDGIDAVNLRDSAGRAGMAEAKKKSTTR